MPERRLVVLRLHEQQVTTEAGFQLRLSQAIASSPHVDSKLWHLFKVACFGSRLRVGAGLRLVLGG